MKKLRPREKARAIKKNQTTRIDRRSGKSGNSKIKGSEERSKTSIEIIFSPGKKRPDFFKEVLEGTNANTATV